MFLIRRSKIEDVPTLLKLAKMVYFINLPADQEIIRAKVLHSRNCFVRVAGAEPGTAVSPRAAGPGLAGHGATLTKSDLFMFTLEDTETGSVLGTSQIISHMGGPGSPTVSLKLSRRDFYSQSLQMGTTMTVGRLHLDESGPSEIGGLILQPSFRKHKQKLGRLLSLIRFHWVGLHPALFAERVIAEMMAPLTADGQNLFWDYFGRRFINLSYAEADRFCQTSREFMISLLPHDDIYLNLLPPEARALVAQVGPETVPARKLLEGLGFKYTDKVDPFDAGPYLEAATADISIVRATRFVTLGDAVARGQCRHTGYVSVLDPDGEFRAIECPVLSDAKGVRLPRESLELLAAEPGRTVGLTEIDAQGKFVTPAARASSKKPAMRAAAGASKGKSKPTRKKKRT